MHTFQPLPFDLVEFNPFTKIGKEWALVTAGNKEKANTMTVSWGGVGVLWGQNVAFIFVRDSRYTKEFIDANEFFSIPASRFPAGSKSRVVPILKIVCMLAIWAAGRPGVSCATSETSGVVMHSTVNTTVPIRLNKR